jgi:threonine/homoserine/homoserine lactone efflux protein
MGAALRERLRTGRRRWWFNAAMGLSLVATAFWMALTT